METAAITITYASHLVSFMVVPCVWACEFNKKKPSTDHWYSLSIGSSACVISILRIQKRNELGVEFYINDDKELFGLFFAHKAEIESDMEMALDWRKLPDKKASRIIAAKKVELDNREKWKEQFFGRHFKEKNIS